MTGDDDVTGRFRALLRRRHFVDRDADVLLIWLPADADDRQALADLVPRIEARHPGSRVSIVESGEATAVRIAAHEADLSDLQATYLDDNANG